MTLYNEIEPYAAQWIRNLVGAGHVVAGDVDERSIVELQPGDVQQHVQAHFFARVPYRVLPYDPVRAIELGVRSVPAVFVGDTRVQAPTPAKIKAAMRRKG